MTVLPREERPLVRPRLAFAALARFLARMSVALLLVACGSALGFVPSSSPSRAEAAPASVAYAVLTDSGELVFFRSTSTYATGTRQTVQDVNGYSYTGYVYAGVEDQTQHTSNPTVIAGYAPWNARRTQIKSVRTSGNVTISPNTSIDGWFYGCTNLTSVDLTRFDCARVVYMRCLFHGCSSLENLNLGYLNAPNVIDTAHMIRDCASLVTVSLPHFGAHMIRTMDSMFENDVRLLHIDWSSLDTSNVWTMWAALRNCSSLHEVDLSSFDTKTSRSSGSTDRCEVTYLLAGCSSLRRVTLGEKFSFKGTAGSDSSNWTTLPDNGYGWQNISVTAENVTVTPVELRDGYDGSLTSTRYSRGTYAVVYGVAYDANGGGGAMASTAHVNGRRSRLAPCSFVREGYSFAGWNTMANGAGTQFFDNQSLLDPPTANVLTLYAQWVPVPVGHDASFSAVDREQALRLDRSGWYLVRAWGGNGGSANASYGHGGIGGYSYARVWLNAGETIYVTVGGDGQDCTGTFQRLEGGFNGGGTAANIIDTEWFGAGGGASHVALFRGLLRNFGTSRDGIVLVAGGGGGGAYEWDTKNNDGGDGGGVVGGDGGDWIEGSGTLISVKSGGRGGTQTQGGMPGLGSATEPTVGLSGSGNAGEFGTGGEGQTGFPLNFSNVTNQEKWCGGGSGWYGGGNAGSWAASAAGGSGHIGATTHALAGEELTSRLFATGTDSRQAFGNTFRTDEGGYVAKPSGVSGGYVEVTYVNDLGGTDDSDNQDADGDGYGDNISFSVPSSILFTVRSDGTLVGPEDATIRNHGAFPIHVSSVKMTSTLPYSFQRMGTPWSGSPSDSVRLLYGTASGATLLDASDYVIKAPVPATSEWNVAPLGSLSLSFAGHAYGLSQDVTQSKTFAHMEWFMTIGAN